MKYVREKNEISKKSTHPLIYNIKHIHIGGGMGHGDGIS